MKKRKTKQKKSGHNWAVFWRDDIFKINVASNIK